MKQNQVIAIACAALLAGALLGYGIGRAQNGRRWNGKDMRARMLEHFSRQLSLTTEQQTAVAAVLESQHQQLRALRAEMRPRFEALRTQTHQQILPLLSSEQQAKYAELEKEFETKRKRFREKRGWGADADAVPPPEP